MPLSRLCPTENISVTEVSEGGLKSHTKKAAAATPIPTARKDAMVRPYALPKGLVEVLRQEIQISLRRRAKSMFWIIREKVVRRLQCGNTRRG